VAEKHGIRFYNDSIATVPEATIFALETLKNVDTLMLGGFDRGIDYDILYEYLCEHPVDNVVFMGPAGERMKTEWNNYTTHNAHTMYIVENDMQKIIRFAIMQTKKGKICLLSPAAASYDQYTNFEKRGKMFKECVNQPFSLKSFNSFNIDATCNDFICINNDEEFDYLFDKKIGTTSFMILGGGCNILFTKDFNGIVIHINTKGIKIIDQTAEFVDIEVKAGENWENFIDFCVKNNFFGVENLAGIPGKVGSCSVQNIGAYGVEVKEVIKEVHARETDTVKPLVFANKECKFGYRDSIFKNELKNKVIITEIIFRLSKIERYNFTYKALQVECQNHPHITLSEVRDKIIEIRKRKLPDIAQIGSAGSFFKNPVINKNQFIKLKNKYPQLVCFEENKDRIKLAAAQLIEISGWKGFRDGDAGVYPFQSLVLINYAKATGQEVWKLAKRIRESVWENFAVHLECEALIV
jgi:UDP-N-acetylmuramate dehydrogenase